MSRGQINGRSAIVEQWQGHRHAEYRGRIVGHLQPACGRADRYVGNPLASGKADLRRRRGEIGLHRRGRQRAFTAHRQPWSCAFDPGEPGCIQRAGAAPDQPGKIAERHLGGSLRALGRSFRIQPSYVGALLFER